MKCCNFLRHSDWKRLQTPVNRYESGALSNAVMCTTGQGCQIRWANAAAPLCLTQSLWTGSPNAAVPAVRNPPAFPPFLPLMKTRGEDIRPSISHKSTSHMFWWISAHVQSPASSGDCAAEPYQHSSENTVNRTTWAIADRRRLDTDGQHLCVWSCDILGSWEAGLFERSRSHAVICREAGWTVNCCSGVNLRLFELGVLHVIGSRVFWSTECNLKLSRAVFLSILYYFVHILMSSARLLICA